MPRDWLEPKKFSGVFLMRAATVEFHRRKISPPGPKEPGRGHAAANKGCSDRVAATRSRVCFSSFSHA